MLVALTVYIALQAVVRVPWQTITSTPGASPDLGRGISAVVGGMIVNVVLMPDLTRYSRSVLDCAVISVTGNGIANGVMVVLAMVPALAFAEIDPMKYMALLDLTLVGFAILVLSTWSVNAVNLYSSGLVTATVLPRMGYGALVVGSGLFATGVALLGLSDRFLDFLVVLGLIVPPVAAVYQVDFFVLRRKDYGSPAMARSGRTNINALIAFGLGAAVGCGLYAAKLSLTGVPTIESYVVAGLTYWGLERWRSIWW
jgi:cytosine permease